jgi:hypothetical protein
MEHEFNYTFIHFVLLEHKSKTDVYSVRNNKSNDQLGIIKWYPSWRQYTFLPTVDTVYSIGCLEDIVDFITLISTNR